MHAVLVIFSPATTALLTRSAITAAEAAEDTDTAGTAVEDMDDSEAIVEAARGSTASPVEAFLLMRQANRPRD